MSSVREAAVARIRGLYVIADDDPARRHPPEVVARAALEAGVRAVQLRLKRTSDRDALALARTLADAARRAGALLFVNDRFDLAALAGAHGVHLGADDLPPERIPPGLRARLLVGVSTHTFAQLEAAAARPIDYVAFGPVFATGSKPVAYLPRGIARLAEAARRAPRPLVAIGGIDAERIGAVARAGAAAAAVISAVADAPDPRAAAAELLRRFEEARP